MSFTNDRNPSGRQMRDDMRALAETDRAPKPLPEIPERGVQIEQRGVAEYVEQASSGAGGGIASPLTEIDGLSREYYEQPVERFAYSSDYLLALEIRPLKNLHMVDANGDDVVLQFKPVQE